MTGAHDTHRRLFDLIFKHGTDAEKQQAREALQQMREFRLAFPGGEWQAMEVVTLPSFLVYKCARVARERQAKARRFSLNDQHGVVRSLEDEIRSVEAQHACCLMIGMSLTLPTSYADARRNGNLGGGLSAFVPKPGSYNLLIGEKEPPRRVFFLMLEDGVHTYRCRGWIRAGEAKLEQYQQKFVRNGVVSNPYLIPADLLHPLQAWFGG